MIGYRKADKSDTESLEQENERLKKEVELLSRSHGTPWAAIPFWKYENPKEVWWGTFIASTAVSSVLFACHALATISKFYVQDPYLIFWIWVAHIFTAAVLPTIYLIWCWKKNENIEKSGPLKMGRSRGWDTAIVCNGVNYIVYRIRHNGDGDKWEDMGHSSSLLYALQISNGKEKF